MSNIIQTPTLPATNPAPAEGTTTHTGPILSKLAQAALDNGVDVDDVHAYEIYRSAEAARKGEIAGVKIWWWGLADF